MDRRDRPSVASFFRAEPCAAGESIELAGDALTHALVRRLAAGEAVRLVNGKGTVSSGSITEVTRRQVRATIASIEQVPQPSPLEILVPVADRDRMLWAAEKCVELQVTAWRPIRCARSQSVAGRGAGDRFAARVLGRMRSALEQCGGAWLPTVAPEANVSDALRSVAPAHRRMLLDAAGEPLAGVLEDGATALAVGPEGGLDQRERDDALAAGWVLASLGPSLLRFETAIVAGAAVVRAAQHSTRSM